MNIQHQSNLYSRLEARVSSIEHQIDENTPLLNMGALSSECLAGFLFADKALSQIANNNINKSNADTSLILYHELSEKLGPLSSKVLPKNIFELNVDDKKKIIKVAIDEGVITEKDCNIVLSSDDSKSIDQLILNICNKTRNFLPQVVPELSSEIKQLKQVNQTESYQVPQFKFS